MKIVKSVIKKRWRLGDSIKGEHIKVRLRDKAIEFLNSSAEAAREMKKCVKEADEIGGMLKVFYRNIMRARITIDDGGFYIVYDDGSVFYEVSAYRTIKRRAGSAEVERFLKALSSIENKYGVTLNFDATFTPTPKDKMVAANAGQRARIFRDTLREIKKALKRIIERRKAIRSMAAGGD